MTFAVKNLSSVAMAGLLFLSGNGHTSSAASADDHWFAPVALAASSNGKTLFIACEKGNRILQFDTQMGKVISSVEIPLPPTGLALSSNGSRLFVTCAAPESLVCVVDAAKGKIIARIGAGHTAVAPVISRDGHVLYVCNRFNNDVSVIDIRARKELRRVSVLREPIAAALTPDGRFLLVANSLPSGRADAEKVAAAVSVIDVSTDHVVKNLVLPDGSTSLEDIKICPDGKYAAVTHILSHYHLPTDQVERGWINANAFSIIDLTSQAVLNTVLLDDPENGAANPWGIGWSPDGSKLVITHAGTHEISVIDFPAVFAKLTKLPAKLKETIISGYGRAARVQSDVPNDLSFLDGAKRRVELPDSDKEPRAVAMVGSTVFVANYFSDTLSKMESSDDNSQVVSIPLNARHKLTIAEKGDFYFHDATLCFQGWQSCSSCHPGDARMDGLNWDLPNDGIGNPKNTKSLLLCFKTPPCMSLGVRKSADVAVRAGIKFILFSKQPEQVPAAINEYLKSLTPVPSRYLVNGKLSKEAQQGKKIFRQLGCSVCHVPPLFTDLQPHDVGTRRSFDGADDKFYTPTLIEVWRTAPYLHDGSAATIRDVLTTRNPSGEHGDVSGLSKQQMDDLCEYLLSL